MPSDRSLTTVLFTDIVDSTARAAALGDRRWQELLGRHHAAVRRELARHIGHEANTAGDAFVATFDDPERAILCARSIRDAVRDLGLEIRAGLHTGQVDRSGETIGGLAVNIGARVAAEAGDGQVLVSQSVRDAVAGGGFRFEEVGERELKGVPDRWRLYRLAGVPTDAVEALPGIGERILHTGRRNAARIGIGAAIVAGLAGLFVVVRDGGEALAPGEAVAEPAAPGVAVLPFMVNDRELDRWREGMVDLLSTNLDGAGGLRGIDSRTVLARWRQDVGPGETGDLAAALGVARDTGARYGVVGRAVSSGRDMRLLADVYDLESGRHLGGRRVEGSPDSIFGLVDRLSIAVLELVLAEGESVPEVDLAGVTTPSITALKAYLDGETAFRASDFDAAIPAYERAVAADSAFALAHLQLVRARTWLDADAPLAREDYARARRFADRLPARQREILDVLLLDTDDPELTARAEELSHRYPDDAQAWFALGEVLFHLPHQSLARREEQDQAFTRATLLDPRYAPAYIHLLDNAFRHADSAAAADLVDAFDELSAGSDYGLAYSAAFRAVFGGSPSRGRVAALLGGLPTGALERATGFLTHPRHLEIRSWIEAELASRPDAPEARLANEIPRTLVARGRVRAAEGAAERLAPAGAAETDVRLIGRLVGLPFDSLAVALALGVADTVPDFRQLVRAILAVDAGRDEEVRAIRRRVERQAAELAARGDSAAAAGLREGVRIVEGRRAMREGDDERAIEILGAAFTATGMPFLAPWLIELHARNGQNERAIRYGETLGPDPWLGLRMGGLYEAVGDREKAIEAYRWVVSAWEGADPELAAAHEEARAAVDRLRAPPPR